MRSQHILSLAAVLSLVTLVTSGALAQAAKPKPAAPKVEAKPKAPAPGKADAPKTKAPAKAAPADPKVKAAPKAATPAKVPDAKPAKAPDAELVEAHGALDVRTPGDEAKTLDLVEGKQALVHGTRVGTAALGTATIVAGPSTLHLEPSTVVVVLGADTAKPTPKPALSDTTLVRGTVRVKVAEGTKKPVVVVAPAKVSVVSGEAIVSVDAEGTTYVSVLEGKVVVESGKKKVELASLHGVKVAKGKAPEAVEALPMAPTWSSPPPKLAWLSGGKLHLPLALAPFKGKARVELAHDEQFRRLVAVEVTDKESSEVSAPKVSHGKYFVRATLVGESGVTGAPGPASAVSMGVLRRFPSTKGKRAEIVASENLFCGLDGAALEAVKAPYELVPARAHVLRCAATADGEGALEASVTREEAGSVDVHVTLAALYVREGHGRRVVTIDLSDAAGQPVDGATIDASAIGDAKLDVVKPSAVPGRYETTARWGASTKGARLRFVVGGAEREVLLPAVATVVAKAPPAPPEPTLAPEMAVGVGVLGASSDLGIGVLASLEGGYRYRLPRGALTLAARATFERFALGPTTTVRCSAATSAPCAEGVTSASSSLMSNVVTLALPIGYRFASASSPINPYVAVVPQLVVDSATEHSTGRVDTLGTTRASIANNDTSTRFGLVAILGLQIRTGDTGAVFFDFAWRWTSKHVVELRDASLSGPMGIVGYRWSL